jgi:uncharacterized protein YfaS (alpha-2-macroglobulin family)
MKFAALAILLVGGATWAQPAELSADWDVVKQAMADGLPKTALERLESIEKTAVARELWADAVKAVKERVEIETTLRGGKAEEVIPQLREALGKAPERMRPLMELVLANQYWQYFINNRWRFSQRTGVAGGEEGQDIAAWSLPRILNEIEAQFNRVMAYEPVLKATPIEDYGVLLEKGTAADAYRPTLFDFAAYELIDFYALGEQAGARAEDALELSADGPALDDVSAFSFVIPFEAARRSPVLRALRLFQKLLEFHAKDEDPSAYADADLNRLQFCRNHVVGESRDRRYAAALDHFVQKWKRHEIISRAFALRARLALESGNPTLAWTLARQGAAAYPKSVGAAQCRNLVSELELPSVSFASEQVWCEPWPELEITYKNLKAVQFCAVAVTFEEMFKTRSGYAYQDSAAGAALLRRRPVKIWEVGLPPAGDYKEHTYRTRVPDNLSPGLYAVFASTDGEYVKEGKPVSWGLFRVSKLALVMARGEHALGGSVLTARGGEPVAGAQVQVWRFDRKNSYKRGQVIMTDQDGAFTIPGDQAGDLLLYAEKDGQAAHTWESVWKGNARERYEPPKTRIAFFTDRAIYRPGQTVQYKGIYFVADQQKGNYYAVGGKTFTVVFNDANGKRMDEQAVKSNDYGSFSGSFTVPRGRGTGLMGLSVADQGQVSFSVEEYKRPKFDVALSPADAEARLGGLVSVSGAAASYSGVPVSGAKVAWRVLREVRFPDGWWGPAPDGGSQEIAHGVTACDGDGRFTVSFFAKPDASVSEKDEPVFSFRVTADVTDVTGETRTGEERVALGYAAWQASIVCDAWQTAQKPVAFGVRLRTHDGAGAASKGVLKVFAVKQPDRVMRPRLSAFRTFTGFAAGADDDPASPETWPDEVEAASEMVQTGTNGVVTISKPLKAGLYRVRFEARDAADKAVSARQLVRVIDPGAKRLGIKVPAYFEAASWRVEPGETFQAVWGSGYDAAQALVLVEQDGRELMRWRTAPGEAQRKIDFPVTESMRGGVMVRTLFVRENRLYADSRRLDVPWSNKRLTLKWEHFTSKLEPGKKESWRAVVSGVRGEKAVAEVVATLYDRSLDAFADPVWRDSFENYFKACDEQGVFALENRLSQFNPLFGDWKRAVEPDAWAYRTWGRRYERAEPKKAWRAITSEDALPAAAAAEPLGTVTLGMRVTDNEEAAKGERGERRVESFKARKNLQETAFFYPHLLSDENGVVTLSFTMPEALTGWRFMAFAHDAGLRGGYLEAEAVTAKDLMVEPNPPRFVREGDEVVFAVKISNRSGKPQLGRARLSFSDAAALKSADAALGNAKPDQDFELESGGSRTLEWRIRVPDEQGFLTYKAVAVTADLADGEEGWLPVLSRRVAVRESLPLPIRGKKIKMFSFDSLAASKGSKTIRHQNLTVQMVSQPAWYAVLALPYLMEYPHACCEQTFNRYYANVLARHIAASDPKIRDVFERWKGTEALTSPLEKSEEMKAVMMEETPWLREAASESAARRNVGILFDEARLRDESSRALKQLEEARISDGTWPWFPGGSRCDFITLYIVAGFGRLRHLGASADTALAVAALPRLDAWATQEYKEIVRNGKKEENPLTPTIALYLYARSFFLKDCAIAAADREAVDYFIGQAKRHWLKQGRQSQAHLALALQRWGDAATPGAIMKSIKERATVDEEQGLFWRDAERPWSWERAPIETQALMVEAFLEVAGDSEAAEACKVWLLKQKQAQDWKSTKATADAAYALLLQGTKVLSSDARVAVMLAGKFVNPETVEAGTGFYEKRFGPSEIAPEMAAVTLTKQDEGVAWGAIYWQYLEDIDKVKPFEGTPLGVRKRLFVKEQTVRGPVLKPAQGVLPQGAELVTRLELRADRDMQFVHVKDQRASCAEPVNVVSRYRWQDGIGYYESTRDTASHFFIDYLPKGVYVFEYACRLQQKGVFRSGMAEIQCLYAPEFSSHSKSVVLTVE